MEYEPRIIDQPLADNLQELLAILIEGGQRQSEKLRLLLGWLKRL